MNYAAINKNILLVDTWKLNNELPERIKKYLLRNNLLYSVMKQDTGVSSKDPLIKKIDNKSKIFFKTLQYISKISRENKIKILVFKTYKYFSEAYLGDVDIVATTSDLNVLIKLLKKDGFFCKIETRQKYECVKRNYVKIEPRCFYGNHGMVLIHENELWANTEIVQIGRVSVYKTSIENDIYAILSNIFYGPKYLDLYIYKVCLENTSAIINIKNRPGMSYVNLMLKEVDGKYNIKFPYFPSDKLYVKFWFNELLFQQNVKYFDKVKHFIFFFYMKYKYIVFNKLEFSKDI